MNISDESHLTSYQSSESSFSAAENRLDEIEAEIAAQGQAIEKFIQNHSKSTNDSEHFLVLRELYKLFKKEVHLNIQIRKQISESIPTHRILVSENQRISEILNGFIKEFNSFFRQSCKDLNDVTQFFLDHIDNSLETEKKIQTIHASTQKAKDLKAKIIDFESSIEGCSQNIGECKESSSMKLVELNSKIENKRMTCSKLQKQIESEQFKKEELLHQIELINQKSSIYVQQINYQRSDFDRMMDIFKQKQQKRKSKLQKLDQELSDSKTKYNCLLQNINKLKSALLEAQKEKSLIESKAKDEIAEALQQRNVYNLLISEIIEKKSQNLINKENLLHRKQEIEKEIMGIEKELEKIDVTITEWKAKLKAKNQIKQYAFDDIDNQTRILVRLREECQTDDIETYLDMKQKENDFLLTENKRLESRLRVTLKNILNIQNENQDLKAKILLYNR
ncbi:hypothetical protein M9Y10_022841 [Tritrichomonas musculus]|uniref:Uncharacterized protein n=1 Tax=Tritrichomonas musculus TaxID=1915356 RepID=A0ABR2KUE6_9EUKA